MKYHPSIYRKHVHGGFRVERRRNPAGFCLFWLVDTCTFNPWGEIGPIADRQTAVEYAWECHEFKTGQRQGLRPMPTLE